LPAAGITLLFVNLFNLPCFITGRPAAGIKYSRGSYSSFDVNSAEVFCFVNNGFFEREISITAVSTIREIGKTILGGGIYGVEDIVLVQSA